MPLPVIFKFMTDLSGARFDTVVGEMDNVRTSSTKASIAIKQLGRSLISGQDPVSSIAYAVGNLAKGFGPLGIGITAGVAAIGYFANESKKAKEGSDKLAEAIKNFQDNASTLDLGGAVAQFQSLDKAIKDIEERANQPGLLTRMAKGAVGFFGGNKMELEANLGLAKATKQQAQFQAQTTLAREKDLIILQRTDPLMADRLRFAEKQRMEAEKLRKAGADQATMDALIARQKEEERDFFAKAVQKDNEEQIQAMVRAADERKRMRDEEDRAYEQKRKKENEAFEEQRRQEEELFQLRQRTVEQGRESAGSILDRVREAAVYFGRGRAVQQIDAAREEQKRLSLGAVAERAGIGTSGFESFRPNEKISELAKTEGDLQRERDEKMFNVFSEMQKLVSGIAEKVEESLTRPVLKPA